jgi:hypothetical protein
VEAQLHGSNYQLVSVVPGSAGLFCLMRFEVLTATSTQIVLVDTHKSCGETYCHHIQHRSVDVTLLP